jgi:3',5'-cyclic AMP phosphodiesterase CpdA
MRIIQISDTHLSPGKTHFADNWAPLALWIAEQCPDLVIHTGDVTVDGADVEEDLRSTAELMRGLGVRLRAVPGNHDVGDPGHKHQPVNEARLQRWRSHFGPDRWVEDIEDRRLIGFDAMLLGSGEREEALQARWLEAAMNDAGSVTSPGSSIARCSSTVRTKATPDIGRSSRHRGPACSTSPGAIPWLSSPAATCTRLTISCATAFVTSGRPLPRFSSGRG